MTHAIRSTAAVLFTAAVFTAAVFAWSAGAAAIKPAKGEILLDGRNFEERSAVLLRHMTSYKLPADACLKYCAPFAAAKIISGDPALVSEGNADMKLILDNALKRVNADPEKFHRTGSEKHFYSHGAMHCYLVCGDRLSPENRKKVREFMEKLDLVDIRGTINMAGMMNAAAFAAASEWPDLRDRNGRTANDILRTVRPKLAKLLDRMYHFNYGELDAFTYMPTNLMHVRMLGEYAKDPGLRHAASKVYYQMTCATIGAWNQGYYVSTPYRSKGWNNLRTGPLSRQHIVFLGWLLYGNPYGGVAIPSEIGRARVSLEWPSMYVAYPGKLRMMPELAAAEKEKRFPYRYFNFAPDDKIKYYRTTYQSENYGLASMTEIPHKLQGAENDYGYKEIKRNLLVWKSDDVNSLFSVCQDNPFRPRDKENRNACGYGENPFHRVFQHDRCMVGAYNVPESYIDGKRYNIYVPFSKTAIKLRQEEGGWVFCHAGSMLFAFRMTTPHVWNQAIFSMKDYDMLSPADDRSRKGAWALVTSEIAPDFTADGTVKGQLDAFRQAVLSKVKLESVDPEKPSVRLTDLDGNRLELDFFPPSSPFQNQYRLNRKVVAPDGSHSLNSPYVKQRAGSDELFIFFDGKSAKLDFRR